MDKAKLKQKILEEIAKTEKQILDYKELTKPISPSKAIDRVSHMDAINNKSVNEHLLDKQKTNLKA